MNHVHTAALRPRLYLICLLMLVTLLAACASTAQAPVGSLDAARSAISNAEQAGARQHAGNELQEARTRLRMAEQAVRDEKMVSADQYAQQSQAAAELAIVKTRAVKAADTNVERKRESDALDTEMQRQGDRS